MCVCDLSTLKKSEISLPFNLTKNGNHTYSEGGELEPENEEGLEGVVPWEVVEENTEGK